MKTTSSANFFDGLVFGFDVGTGSIGYSVRRGGEFLDVGVLICDSEGSDLSKRRDLRRQRRTLRSRNYRHKWFAKELEKLGLPRPKLLNHDPITLRLRALDGEPLTPEELHAALTHLFKRRGYSKVPWAKEEAAEKDTQKPKKKDDDEGVIIEKVKEIKEKLAGKHPCQLLAEQRKEAGKSPTKEWARKIYWPRESLAEEFRAIVAAQQKEKRSPKLAEKADWLLFGDTNEVKHNGNTHHVFFNITESRNPGVLGLRWPRFDNRGPALDSFQPVDEEGRPLHVVRKNKDAFLKTQWELALMNFRVLDAATRSKRDPRLDFPIFIENLRNEWNKKGKVTETRLKKLAEPFADKFLLIENQNALTPDTGSGRARYSSPTLALLKKDIGAGRRVDPPQPTLRRAGESRERALDRYLSDIKHPLVRHRLILFRGLLAQLIEKFGEPNNIVVEAVRSLAMGEKAKREFLKRQKENQNERADARKTLRDAKESTSRNSLLRYRLFKEAKARCPYCLCPFCLQELLLKDADIEHLVPKSRVDSNEFSNLTIAHVKCNRELKGNKTPYEAFAHTENWEAIKRNAEQCFKGRKLEIFLSPKAEELIEQKADLTHTAYIARVVRHIALLQLNWLADDGRDPSYEKGNLPSTRFQVTNGQLTSRLRQAWGLNQILHSLPRLYTDEEWNALTPEQQTEHKNLVRLTQEKNRGDLRHHALDAMVIVCTLPWLAHRTHGVKDEFGRHGWWTQNEKQRSKAANPLFPNEGQMHEVVKKEIEKVVVKHHVSRSNHQQSYATTLYSKKAKNTYVAREVFTTLTPKNLEHIWPKEFAYYCEAAWTRYTDESSDIEGELKKTKNCVPENFTRKLCFSHFQKWRQDGSPEFYWPEKIKIPIRNVRLISVKDDTAVVPFSPGTHAFVKRTGYKEVQVFLAEDGKSFVPVFIPYWKGDKLVCETPIKQNTKPIIVIRRGMVVEAKKAFSAGQPPGKYRVLVTGQLQIKLLPHHVANKEEAIVSFGLGKKGLQPMWADFIRVLGYELPHPPSVKPQPAGAAEA